MPGGRSNGTQRSKDEELIEMAAEQFADLLWKHFLSKKDSEKIDGEAKKPIIKGENIERDVLR